MKRLIVPAISALLLAGLPAQAQFAHPHSIQLAQNSGGGDQQGQGASRGASQGDNQKAADDSTGRKARGDKNRTDKGAASTGGAGSSGPSGGAATGSPTTIGGRGQGGAATTGGAAATGGGPTGMPTGGAAMGGSRTGGAATTGGGQTGAHATFGTRPPNWNNYPRQFDRNVYQRNVTAPRQYHWQSYNRPGGWYYQRWSYGQIFPRMFWAQDYWLTDYWMFDLPIPPYGYVWVRYGDDAVLINKRTGEVLQVEYGLFD